MLSNPTHSTPRCALDRIYSAVSEFPCIVSGAISQWFLTVGVRFSWCSEKLPPTSIGFVKTIDDIPQSKVGQKLVVPGDLNIQGIILASSRLVPVQLRLALCWYALVPVFLFFHGVAINNVVRGSQRLAAISRYGFQVTEFGSESVIQKAFRRSPEHRSFSTTSPSFITKRIIPVGSLIIQGLVLACPRLVAFQYVFIFRWCA